MKKAGYIALLAVETLAGLLMMGLVYSNVGWLACAVPLTICAVLLARLIARLKKDGRAEERKKTLRRIALVMLIPAATGAVLTAYVVVSLLLYFG